MVRGASWSRYLIWFFIGVSGWALTIPSLTSPVIDNAHILGSSTRERLAAELKQVHQKGGPQVQVLTLRTLDGLTIEQAAMQIVEHWQLGDRERDDGVLLLVAPSERKVRIEVGQGLEGRLPDVLASRLIREVIVPEFRANNFELGIVLGVQYILQATTQQSDQLPLEELGRQTREDHRETFSVLLILFFIALFFISSVVRAAHRPGWQRSSTGFGGYGSSWRGGGGRGGFGGGWGGGGGGFSGGGASGGW